LCWVQIETKREFPKNVIRFQDYSAEQLLKLFDLAETIRNNRESYAHVLDGKVMESLFYEASTRTRLSSESAMLRLGGRVTGFSGTEGTSVKKGESLEDTIRMASSYGDVIVLRHMDDGSAEWASRCSKVPLINGGDGENQHPTQGMLDLYTVWRELGDISGKSAVLAGDLKYGRTTHSLVVGLGMFGARAVLVSPENFEMPEKYIRMTLEQNPSFDFVKAGSLEDAVKETDVLYMTRIQRERLPDESEYNKIKSRYEFREEHAEMMKDRAIIMHPLPKVDEIAYRVNKDHRAKYYDQAENGVFMRMAMLCKIFGVEK